MAVSPIAYLDYNIKVITKVLRKYCSKQIDSYLDLGAGIGLLTSYIASIVKPKEIIIVDIDRNALEVAQRKGFKTIMLDLNVDKLPLNNNSVDLVTAFELIEHLWNKDNMLEETLRILKPGGLFIVSTPNLASLVNRLLLLMGKTPIYYSVSLKYEIEGRASYGHISLYTASSLRDHMSKVGFEVLEIHGLLTHYAYKNLIVKAITMLTTKLRPPLAPDILLVARKPETHYQQ